MSASPRVRISVAAIALAIAGITVVAWVRCRPLNVPPASEITGPVALSGPTMGSTWMVRVPRPPAGMPAGQVQSSVQALLDQVEREMSTYRADSALSRFNRSTATTWVDVPSDVARVVGLARRVSDQTGGAFDVTVGPLVNLWGFGPTHPAGPFGTIPSDALIEAARRHVGYRLLEARDAPPALRKSDADVYVDLSGIAKGDAAERVGRRLDALGATDYLIAVGGEMRARGRSPAGRPWRVGIETPTPGTRRVLCEVELPGGFSLSTSGDYRNYFDSEGHRYSHEIDPATGRPAADAPASVTVAHASGGYADAMATALMVLGSDRGYALAERLGLPALFILRKHDQFEARATPAFQPLLMEAPTSAPADPDCPTR